MASVEITVNGALMDGHKITFKAPCDCVNVENLRVRHVKKGTQQTSIFTMRDSHGNDLTGLGNLFSEGAYVDVVLDTNNGVAYLQNAATNAYLEGKFGVVATPVDNLESDRADLPPSARQGKILNESLKNIKDTYTDEEQIVGTWINGKTIYRKIFDLGTMPNATTTTIELDVNFENIINEKYYCIKSPGLYYTIPYYAGANNQMYIMFSGNENNKTIAKYASNNRSGLNAYAILEYTKAD